MSNLIDGKEFADKLCNKIAEEVNKLKDKNIKPGLAVVRVGEDPASAVYVNMKAKKTEEVGMHSVTKILDNDKSINDKTNEILNKISLSKFAVHLESKSGVFTKKTNSFGDFPKADSDIKKILKKNLN